MKKVISTDKVPQAIGPYSQAIEAQNFVFCSGQIPLQADGNFLDGNAVEQTKQVMDNLGEVLKAAGLDFGNVVKTTIYLTDLNDFQTVNETYGSYFPKDPPARATVQVAALPKGAKVEIEAIALKS